MEQTAFSQPHLYSTTAQQHDDEYVLREAVRTIYPGEKGSQHFVRQYGDKLIAVRYRKSDAERLQTTIEISVDNSFIGATDSQLPMLVNLAVNLCETGLRERIRQAGGWWDIQRRVWRLDYDKVIALGLVDRIIQFS